MSEVIQNRIYEEGNYGFKVFPLNADGTYGTGTAIEGLVSVDITFSSTKTNTPAEDVIDYLHRESPLKGEGTITLVGLKNSDYAKLYSNCVDTNGAVVGGRKNQSKKVGVIFFNTKTYLDENNAPQSKENMISLPNCIFALPNLQTQTIQEDDTTIRNIELSVECNPLNFTTSGGSNDRFTWSMIDADTAGGAWNTIKTSIYFPDSSALLIKLATPVVSIGDTGLASWSAVTHASGYKVKVNGVESASATTSVQLTANDTIQVKAVGDGTTYSDSDYSAVQTYTSL